MHPEYFHVRFRTPRRVSTWPDRFVIVTAYATTGSTWTEAENVEADRSLERALRALPGARPLQRVTGFSPSTGHAEPGWAAPLDFEDACDLGQRFRQDALYVVDEDDLYVSYCDHRRGLVAVGSFRERLEERAG